MNRRNFLKVVALTCQGGLLGVIACSPYNKHLKCPEAYSENSNRTRNEPIFNLKTPILFAHRGGAREKPESTSMAFDYAMAIGVDVLELDIQLTKDRKFVVWHGPEMSNVRIEVEADRACERKRNRIYAFDWAELDGNAWVADPETVDLSRVPKDDNRRLMLLSDFLEKYPDVPLNIEMKESFSRRWDAANSHSLQDTIEAFVKVLDDHHNKRKIVVVSRPLDPINRFRRCTNGRYPTGLAFWEQVFFDEEKAKGFAFETTYVLVNEDLIRRVRISCGSIFVFLTSFGPIPAIDKNSPISENGKKKIFKLLDMGVDGIMTDRPGEVKAIMDDWRRGRS
jgi:glycerophosphoryl diester phosphodiesterase